MWAMGTSRSRRRGDEGYTLVEFAIAMGVFLVFMGLATPFMFSQLRSALRTEQNVDVQQTARSALRTVVRELRQAQVLYQTDEKPSAKVAISFGTDLNADGQISSYSNGSALLEQITYALRGDRLCKLRSNSTGQCQQLAEGVSALRFTMLGSNPVLDADGDGIVEEPELNTNGDTDSAGNPIWQAGELANVTRVHVELTLGAGEDARTYAGEAWLRNRVAA